MVTGIPFMLFILFGLITPSFTNESAKKVKVSAFFEALCPDSRNFVLAQLYPTYKELKDIMEVEANAFGKAKSEPNGTGYSFKCQHGSKECHRNMLMACAKNYLQEEEYLHFVNCIMDGVNGVQMSDRKCLLMIWLGGASFSGKTPTRPWFMALKLNQISSELMETHLRQMVLGNLNDSKENRRLARHNLKQVVCKHYEGTPHPACNGTSQDTIQS
ncbi:unnamed protein product, partial [Meganyctiphanes norvegica]